MQKSPDGLVFEPTALIQQSQRKLLPRHDHQGQRIIRALKGSDVADLQILVPLHRTVDRIVLED